MQVHLFILAWLATVCLMSCYHTASATNLYDDTDTEQLLQSLEALGILQEPVNEDMLLYNDGSYSKRSSRDDARRFSVCYDPIKFKWRRCRLSSRRQRDRKSLLSRTVDTRQFSHLHELLETRQHRSTVRSSRLVL